MTAATSRRRPPPCPTSPTFSSVDTEKVVEAGADLVVAGGLGFTPAEAITKLRSLGIPVLVVYAPSVDGVLKDIELLGAAVGESEAATEITDGMRADMKLTTDAAAAEAEQGRRQAACLLRDRLHGRDRRDLRARRTRRSWRRW